MVLRSGPGGPGAVHRQGKRGRRAEGPDRCDRSRELRQGRMVGHLQASAPPGVGCAVHSGRVPADRLLGVGRVLARARQPPRSHLVVFGLRRTPERPVVDRSDDQDGAHHPRHRTGHRRLGAVALRLSRPRWARATESTGSSPPPRRELSRVIRRIHVQEHLRSRRQLGPLQPRRVLCRRAGQGVLREAGGVPRLRGETARLSLPADGVHAAGGVHRRSGTGAPAQDPRQLDHDGPQAHLRQLSRWHVAHLRRVGPRLRSRG